MQIPLVSSADAGQQTVNRLQMNQFVRGLLAFVILLSSGTVLADGRLYGELQFGAGGISHSDLDFVPVFGTVTAGAFIFTGIGIEVFADTGLEDGSDENFDLSIEEAYGIALRFQSPPVRRTQGFIVLGAVNYTLDQESGGVTGSSVEEDFTGVRVSVGVMQRLVRFPYIQFTAEYRHYNADDPIRLDALVVGLRVNAP